MGGAAIGVAPPAIVAAKRDRGAEEWHVWHRCAWWRCTFRGCDRSSIQTCQSFSHCVKLPRIILREIFIMKVFMKIVGIVMTVFVIIAVISATAVAIGVFIVVATRIIVVNVHFADLGVITIQQAFRVFALIRGPAIPSALWERTFSHAIVSTLCVALRFSTNGPALRTLLLLTLRRTNNGTLGWWTHLMTIIL
jgi:hypothetical protein